VGGDACELDKGCYLDSTLPHRYRNPGDEFAEFIVSITPPSY
jgi:hypothetical protein